MHQVGGYTISTWMVFDHAKNPIYKSPGHFLYTARPSPLPQYHYRSTITNTITNTATPQHSNTTPSQDNTTAPQHRNTATLLLKTYINNILFINLLDTFHTHHPQHHPPASCPNVTTTVTSIINAPQDGRPLSHYY